MPEIVAYVSISSFSFEPFSDEEIKNILGVTPFEEDSLIGQEWKYTINRAAELYESIHSPYTMKKESLCKELLFQLHLDVPSKSDDEMAIMTINVGIQRLLLTYYW